MRDKARAAELKAHIDEVDELLGLGRHLQDTGSVNRSSFDRLQGLYIQWYRSALALVDQDLRDRFRDQYEAEGSGDSIKRFLESGHNRAVDRWTYPVDRHYLAPLSRQGEILIETWERLRNPIPSEAERGARITRGGVLKAALISGAAVVLIGIITILVKSADSATQQPLPSTSIGPTVSIPSEPTLTDATTAPTSPSPSSPETTSPSGVVYLDSLEHNGGKLSKAPQQVDGIYYLHALTAKVGTGCPRTGPTEYVVPDGAEKFEAVVGIPKDSGKTGSEVDFAVYLYRDDQLVPGGQVVATHAKPQKLTVPVEGATRIKLEAISRLPARTFCRHEPMAVWGDPKFLTNGA